MFMFKCFGIAAGAVVAAMVAATTVSAQAPNFQPVALTAGSAEAAVNAVPDVLAVAQNYQGAGGGLDGLAGLSTYAAAQADLNAAVAGNGFSSYGDWVAAIQTVVSTYGYIQSAGAVQQMGPAMDAAIQQILNNPSIPQAQKEALIAQMGGASAAMAGAQANAPSAENQVIVMALMPQIEAMIQTMQAMQ